MQNKLIVRKLGLRPYTETWEPMQAFTKSRTKVTSDEIWLVEHFPVFTQGYAGKSEHIISPGNIPVIQTDRGGQVTYHGPGQLVIYILFDLHRLHLSVRQLVSLLENAIIHLLTFFSLDACSHSKAPGVYVGQEKIASIGLRIQRGCTYHGIAFNVNMDLEPFSHIHPCGFDNLKMTQLNSLVKSPDLLLIENKIVEYLSQNLNYNALLYEIALPKPNESLNG